MSPTAATARAMPPAFSGFEMPGPEFWAGVAGVIALCCCLVLILAVVATIVQYVARTALYRSVINRGDRRNADLATRLPPGLDTGRCVCSCSTCW